MLTYKQARAHAQQCGIDVSAYKAMPISGNAHDNPVHAMLARPVYNPENMGAIYPACMLLTASMMANLSIQYGVDYVICYK